MFWTEEKLGQRISELQKYRYTNKQPIEHFQTVEEQTGEEIIQAMPKQETTKMNIGDRWEGRDRYLWLKTEVELPAQWQGEKVVGVFDFGKTGGGHNSGFESLLYVNGEPMQAVDGNHKEVFFPDRLIGQRITLKFRLWSGLEGIKGNREVQEHRLQEAFISCLHEAADDLYYTAGAALDTVAVLGGRDAKRALLLQALDRAFKQIDWRVPGNEAFYESVEEANDKLHNELKPLQEEHPLTVRAVGHTHIDVAWLWRLKHTREKAGRSFSTVLKLMDQYPEYQFLQTQPQLYEYIKDDYPEIYEQIKQRIAEGRWEAGGAMWLEADCNIPSGESLSRQLLYGQRFLEHELGVKRCRYLWLPDVFGYSWALPQILKQAGIDTFITTKISWNQYNRMPHDTFTWRGIDGTEIAAHFITTPDGSSKYTYNGEIEAESIQGIWDQYRDRSFNNELLLSYGYGDGGGGVNRDMLEKIRRFDEMPGLPNVKTGRVDQYLDGLHERMEQTDQYVHTWDGELYLEYHRGTYTSQAYNKKMNRTAELRYRRAEWLDTLAYLQNGSWHRGRQEKLQQGWKIILRNQFHDIIPGSSIREVYEDSTKEYAKALELVEANEQETKTELLKHEQAGQEQTVFNPASHSRGALIQVPDGETGWTSHTGEQLQMQTEESGEVFVHVPDLPALGYKVIYAGGAAQKKEEKLFQYESRRLETPFYTIDFNDRGQLVSVYDKESGREALDGPANVLEVFEDKPLSYDAWDIDIFYKEKQYAVSDLKKIHLAETGPLRAVIELEWSYQSSSVYQKVIVYSHSRRIDFKTTVDWHEHQQLLKAAFPVKIRATEATYDIQYGNVTRPTHWNTSWDMAMFETVGHQWADLSERDYGISLLNDCKYGYDIKDNVMKLTLLKSAIEPDPTQDQGEHIFTYSLFPHKGGWFDGGTVQEATELNIPAESVDGAMEAHEYSFLQTEAANITVDAVKQAEDDDGIIVRLHEHGGVRGEVTFASAHAFSTCMECSLLEEPVKKLEAGSSLTLHFKPYELKTIKLTI
ncbi:alpha-mannosidase [Marinococcus halophilus]|uniref:Alpha-mannosidase n=1 Tax=Marinococcus halophilus TaxID=1371 RepID=A0A510Y345_MARHA|nr:alpha-mannosidase [Marinococcus halophilus]OZT81785.1 alpha-mannosidase [Marinococcus halophilus]GEK57746.1 alpha-mannosidase [Marinococcus halophilus]